MTRYNLRIITILQEILKEYKKIIICQNHKINMLSRYQHILESGKCAVISNSKNVYNMCDYFYVGDEVMDEILDLYGMYEFSNKIIILEDSIQYGNLYNYIKMGIITEEEMLEVLLNL